MVGYRIFFLGPDGKIFSNLAIDVADDEAALALVSGHYSGIKLEIWEGPRRVTCRDGRAIRPREIADFKADFKA